MNPWLLTYDGWDPAQEGLREALGTLANGYLSTRGALPEASADAVHYPGTYVAGLYNRLGSQIAGRTVTNESIVNLPNWLALRFRLILDGVTGPWIDEHTAEVVEHRVELDVHRGVLTRFTRFADEAGRVLRVTQRRIVSMAAPHVAALETTLVAEDFDGAVIVESALDATVANLGVARYRELPSQHLAAQSAHVEPDTTLGLIVATNESHVRVAMAARHHVHAGGAAVDHDATHEERTGWVAARHTVPLRTGEPVTIEKVVTVFTGRDHAIGDPAVAALELATHLAGGFDELLDAHVTTWRYLWNRVDLELGTDHDIAMVLHLHLFHLLATVSPHSALLDVGVPARGLHGEAYRGHIFWDELFILPFFSLRLPELTRSLLLYRYRRLDRARRAAREAGFEGAMFPWQSSADGREETQTMHLNPESGRWLPDVSHRQRHVNAAIAYNVWHYFQASGDEGFMRSYGAELIIEIARFWSSIATYDRSLDRYSIRGVMGPDEYHEGYPDREEPGLDDNAYTNVMAVWCLLRALEVLASLSPTTAAELRERLSVTDHDLARWEDVTTKMRVCFHQAPDGSGPVLSQFDGFEHLEELDWEGYRRRYGDIARLDRILEAEGDSANRYQVAKQPDVTMLFYLLSAEELAELFERLDYQWDGDIIPRTIDYYEQRTSHGSTLSRVVQAWLHARGDRARSWAFFCQALHSDVDDIQGGTTAEGVHLGAMAGTVDLLQRCYTGIEVRADVLRLNPAIPVELGHLDFDVRYRDQTVHLHISNDQVRLAVAEGPGPSIEAEVRGDRRSLAPGDAAVFDL